MLHKGWENSNYENIPGEAKPELKISLDLRFDRLRLLPTRFHSSYITLMEYLTSWWKIWFYMGKVYWELFNSYLWAFIYDWEIWMRFYLWRYWEGIKLMNCDFHQLFLVIVWLLNYFVLFFKAHEPMWLTFYTLSYL